MSQIYAQLDPTVRFETSYQAQKGTGATQAAAVALTLVYGLQALVTFSQTHSAVSAPFDLAAGMSALSLLGFFLARRTSALWTAVLVLDLAAITAIIVLPGIATQPATAFLPTFALLTAIRGFRASLALRRLARAGEP